MSGAILVAAGDQTIGARLHALCAERTRSTLTTTVSEALTMLERMPDLGGLVVSTCLSDAPALDIADQARRRFDAPALVISSKNSHAVIHRAFELGAAYLCTPIGNREVTLFAERAAERGRERQAAHLRAAQSLALKTALTPRERQIVTLAVAGVRRREIATALGVAESTLKWHIRSLLNKCDASNLTEVVRRAMSVVPPS
jgi:DNA-binding NarL/FixJ family response regulator